MSAVKYTLRTLTADDMFPMFSIISKIGLKEFKECFASEDVKATIENGKNTEIDVSSIGVSVALDIASIIFSNIGKCKSDIYQLLAGLSGMKEKDIAALPMNVFMKMIIDVVKKEEFTDFFQAAAKLFN